MGVTVSHASLLTQCRALTQACGYSEGKACPGTCPESRSFRVLAAGEHQVPRQPHSALLSKFPCRLQNMESTCHQFPGVQGQLQPEAELRGSVFCIKNTENRLIGHTTVAVIRACGFGSRCHACKYTNEIFMAIAYLLVAPSLLNIRYLT